MRENAAILDSVQGSAIALIHQQPLLDEDDSDISDL